MSVARWRWFYMLPFQFFMIFSFISLFYFLWCNPLGASTAILERPKLSCKFRPLIVLSPSPISQLRFFAIRNQTTRVSFSFLLYWSLKSRLKKRKIFNVEGNLFCIILISWFSFVLHYTLPLVGFLTLFIFVLSCVMSSTLSFPIHTLLQVPTDCADVPSVLWVQRVIK